MRVRIHPATANGLYISGLIRVNVRITRVFGDSAPLPSLERSHRSSQCRVSVDFLSVARNSVPILCSAPVTSGRQWAIAAGLFYSGPRLFLWSTSVRHGSLWRISGSAQQGDRARILSLFNFKALFWSTRERELMRRLRFCGEEWVGLPALDDGDSTISVCTRKPSGSSGLVSDVLIRCGAAIAA